MANRTLIKGGTVLTQDPALGELARADILVEGDTIAEVGQNLDAGDAKVIDAAGDIVIPGFIDTHRHTWETSIRTCAPDYTLGAYFGAILDKFAPNYRPDDVYAANQWGALECINAGITTLVDWSHIMNTPDHADAAIRGLQDTGIRSVFAFGFPNTSIAAWWFGSELTINGDDARRVRKQYFNSDDGLITMGLSTRGPGFCVPDVVRYDWELAKELGVNITVHVAMDRFGYTKLQLIALRDMDLLYPNTTYVHSSHLTDEEWGLVRDSGSNVSFAPQIELQMGHGWAPAAKALEYAVPIGLSSDVATTAPADQFTQMRAIFASERARRHSVAWDTDTDSTDLITCRQVLGVGHDRRREGGGTRRPDGLHHAGQEGGPGDHRRGRGERRAGHRPGGGRGLRGRRLERQDGHDRWRDPQARRQAPRDPGRAPQAGRGLTRLPGEQDRPGARLDRQRQGLARQPARLHPHPRPFGAVERH